ncbi:MAG TPA: YicC family protein [Rhodobacteraceae bacterium]|nr:YicC family protein [Paracoccaceae bacterium]
MLHSMTGFATLKGQEGPWSWTWDIRAVNGRGFDLRLKLPDWIEGVEIEARKLIAARISRGNVTLGLKIGREAAEGAVQINAVALDSVLAVLAEIDHAAQARGVALSRPSTVDVAAMRGVLEASAHDENLAPLVARLVAGLPELLAGFDAMRAHEGAALAGVLADQLAAVEALVAEAGTAIEARREAQGEALRTALARVLDNSDGAEPDRVAQELAMIAVKTDVREEIDRLGAHVAQARNLIAEGGPCGRKLDFLMQEFNREANTLCAKSQFQELTRIGLDIKAVVDQMREQVQNVE